MRIIVHGAGGRMGRKICDLIQAADDLELVGCVDRLFADAAREQPHADATPRSGRMQECPSADLIVDFSSDAGAANAANAARERKTALLVATTALSAATHAALAEAAAVAPVLTAANTSIGANLLARLARETAVALGIEADVSLVEAHHVAKQDAPSGTALMLAKAVRAAGGELREEQILSIRGGDVPGEHTLRFAWAGEIVELRHAVTSRDVFAAGALRAGRWLVRQPPGLFTMHDMLASRS